MSFPVTLNDPQVKLSWFRV